MAEITTNRFSLLDEEQVLAEQTSKQPADQATEAPKKTWADYSDEDDEDFYKTFPSIKAGKAGKTEKLEKPETNNNEKDQHKLPSEEKKAWEKFDRHLSKLKTITISHTSSSGEVFSRTLKVISKDQFDHKLNLIKRYKSRRKDGSFDWKQNNDKISLTNELMKYCYKDTVEPYRFNYPVINIYIKKGDEIKKLVRDEVFKDSRAQFEVAETSYFPPFVQQ